MNAHQGQNRVKVEKQGDLLHDGTSGRVRFHTDLQHALFYTIMVPLSIRDLSTFALRDTNRAADAHAIELEAYVGEPTAHVTAKHAGSTRRLAAREGGE